MFFSPRCCQPPHWNGKSLLNLCETRGTVLPCASFALIASSTCPSCRLRRSVDWDGVCYQMWVIWPAELWDFTNEYDIMDSGCLQIREKKHVIAVVKGKWYIWPLKTLKKNSGVPHFGSTKSIHRKPIGIWSLLHSKPCPVGRSIIPCWAIYIWLVVDLPLWKIWVRQLGLWNSQYMEKQNWCSRPPIIYIYIHIYIYINGERVTGVYYFNVDLFFAIFLGMTKNCKVLRIWPVKMCLERRNLFASSVDDFLASPRSPNCTS